MLKQASSLLNSPILSLHTGRKLGIVYDFVPDSEGTKILALVAQKGMFLKTKVVAVSDIQEFSAGFLGVYDEGALVDPSEIVRVKEAFSNKIKILGHSVVTESGIKVGKVEDFLLDLPSFYLVKIYVKTNILRELFEGEIVIPQEKIYKITKKAIIVSDDVIKRKKVKETRMIRAKAV